jgi:hypothetical protein
MLPSSSGFQGGRFREPARELIDAIDDYLEKLTADPRTLYNRSTASDDDGRPLRLPVPTGTLTLS